MDSATADALGLSRAILCNDALVQRLMMLKRTENFYRGLVTHAKATLHAFFDLTQIYKGTKISNKYCQKLHRIITHYLLIQLFFFSIRRCFCRHRSARAAATC